MSFLRILLTICLAAFSAQAANDLKWTARLTIALPAEAAVITFSPDASLLVVGHADGRITIWETKEGKLIKALSAHAKGIRRLGFTPRGDKLITLGQDNRARVWSVSDWDDAGSIEDIGFSFAISDNSRWVVGQDSQQAIWLWDLTTLKRVRQLGKSGIGGALDMCFLDAQHLVVVYGYEPHLIDIETSANTVLPVRTSKPQMNVKQVGDKQFSISLGSLDDDSAMSHHLAVNPGRSLVAVGRGWYGKPDFVDVFDLAKMQRVGRYKPKDGGTQASFSFDNSLLAIEGAKNVTLWKVSEGKQIGSVQGNGLVQFSPKSLELAVTNDNSLTLYVPK